MRRSSSACGGSVWRRICANHGDCGPLVDSISAALSALADSPVDVLVSDIGMPDGTGYDLMARVQERAGTAGRAAPPAVAVTAYAGADDRERALAAGFLGWAPKPIDPASARFHSPALGLTFTSPPDPPQPASHPGTASAAAPIPAR